MSKQNSPVSGSDVYPAEGGGKKTYNETISIFNIWHT